MKFSKKSKGNQERLQGIGTTGEGIRSMSNVLPVLPAAGNEEGRNRKGQCINTWLQAWCHRQNLGSFGYGSVKPAADLLSLRGKRLFMQELAGLTEI